jgi:hypothetical protein
MVWAAMPKTAIDEHSDSGRTEEEISAAAHSWEHDIDPIPQTLSMEQAPNSHLGLRVSAPLTDHTLERLVT